MDMAEPLQTDKPLTGTADDAPADCQTRVHPTPPERPGEDWEADSDEGNDCVQCMRIIGWLAFIFTFPLSLLYSVKLVRDYERAVIFRLGRLLPGGAKGPGIFFVLPCVEEFIKVDLRTISFDVPPQQVLTRDSLTVTVDAVVFYRVSNATMSITKVEDANASTRFLAQTTLRNVIGTKTLSEILADREHISQFVETTLDEATDPWGIKVERVEIKDVILPFELQRSMAVEAEATRDAKAKIIAAEGEQNAARALKEAADTIAESPTAIQLRYLQTLNSISAEKNSTIVFPIPIDFMQNIIRQ